MTDVASLTSRHDGFSFQVLHRQAHGPRQGGVIVLQEIFGLDSYVHADVERWAAAGFEVLAPSMFDRHHPGFVANHDGPGIAAGFELMRATSSETAMGDIAACVDHLATRGVVCVVGYCYGGRLAWEAAAKVDGLAAASCYYGQIAPLADLSPRAPTICHFGRNDPSIDAEANRAAIKRAHPETPVFIYERSGHGFNNTGAPGSDPQDAALARSRTLDLFRAAAGA